MRSSRRHWFGLWLGSSLVVALTSSCAARWENPRKSPEQVAQDKTACTQRAEQISLLRSGRPKVDYMLGRISAMPGMSRGEGPMEMLDRSRTEGDFWRDFEGCMSAKGYVRAGESK